jgi:2-methylaconitate cis-trans-isomerase PrpF
MAQARIPAVFMRGGTSRAIFFRQEELPDDLEKQDHIFLAALGSPDPYGRQLDGLGGGYSSVSKIAVIGPPGHAGDDVDFTFAQVDVPSMRVDRRGTCGNISSAVGPFAIDEGLVSLAGANGETSVTFFNTNTRKRVVARVPLDPDGSAAVEGDFELPGVPGRGARIALDFLDPGGAVTGKLLPTGRARDELDVPGLGRIEASLVDATNPMVFVRAADLGLRGVEDPAALDADAIVMTKLESIRAAATVAMGMAPDAATATGKSPAVPKIALVSPAQTYADLSGGTIAADDADLNVLIVSMGKIHRAVALTGAMCLAVAAHLDGTLVREVARPLRPGQDVRIGHPSGVLPLAADVKDGIAEKVVVYRTARRLMEGYVRVPQRAIDDPSYLRERAAQRAMVVAD